MTKLDELRRAYAAACDALGGLVDDAAAYAAKKAEITELEARIARTKEAEEIVARSARPLINGRGAEITAAAASVLPPDPALAAAIAVRARGNNWQPENYVLEARKLSGNWEPDPKVHFRSIGEQLLAVARYYLGRDVGSMDPRLVRAPQGASEMDPSAGGFVVQTDFQTAIFARAYEYGQILSRAQKLTISSNANGIKIPAVDETSRANGSRWGGVSSSWVAEGTAGTASKPKFRLIELDLKKLISLMYITDELLADASILGSIAMQAFSEEIQFMVEDAMVRGDGAGKPQGILNANAKVSVAKETGQTAGTVVFENITKMWSRMWSRSRPSAAWFINQDVEPALFSMGLAVGTGGLPVYLPAGGASSAPYASLMGRPVIPIEYADTLGTEGDIMLLDLGQYVLVDKGGVNTASSMHVAFNTDEMTFRITYRVDGESIWHSALTPYKGSATKSPFITLAPR